MWRNYLTVGFRSLMKSRTYAFINVFGLALGIAACLLILVYVRYETSYDGWLPEAERTYQFQQHYTDNNTGELRRMQLNSYVAGQALRKDFPQIETMVYAKSARPTVLQGGQASLVENVWRVDGDLFDVLAFPLVAGDPETALDDVGSLVFTRSEAIRRFGREDVVGETLTLVNEAPLDHRVTGVIEDLPANSHIKLNMIARYDPASAHAERPQFLTNWGWQGGFTYLRLKPGADPAAITAALPAWEKRNIPDETVNNEVTNAGDTNQWDLVNVRDVHLGGAKIGAMRPGNSRASITTFTVIALLVLAMACINFTNLATARASQRAREVALRKVLGASRRQLIVQFLVESMLVADLATLIGLTLVELALPTLGAFLEADLQMTYVGEGGLLGLVALLALIVGAAGGVYPAFYLSRFQPATVLRANKSAADASGSGRLRNILVVGQFAVSIGLIICTTIVYAQSEHGQRIDPGYDREGLIQLAGISDANVEPVARTLQQEIGRIEGVEDVGTGEMAVAVTDNSTTNVRRGGGTDTVEVGTYAVDDHFFQAMGIRVLAGRSFSPQQALDDATLPPAEDVAARTAFAQRGLNVMVNASAARLLGFSDPQSAVGQPIQSTFGAGQGLITATIVGVVGDSRFRSVRDPLQPIMFRFRPEGQDWMVIRHSASADPRAVMDRIEQTWRRVVPDAPFQGEFADTLVADLYQDEAARTRIFAGFALLAVVISCLGLFGLAAFTADRRTKEIGIRKVLGARVRDIVKLLAWQFSKPVVLANLIAWPVAWWVMRDWLNTFDDRVALTPTPFVVAGLIAFAIAIGTVAGHAFRVARLNPIHALRYE